MDARPRIVITCGLPGSGKSTYLTRLGVNPVSTDDLRRQLADDAADQSIHDRVYATAQYLIRQRIAIGRPATYLDATNLTRKDRRHFVKLARELNCPIDALFFDVPVEVCLERNRMRGRLVPDDVIHAMALKLQPPSLAEGFGNVTVIT